MHLGRIVDQKCTTSSTNSALVNHTNQCVKLNKQVHNFSICKTNVQFWLVSVERSVRSCRKSHSHKIDIENQRSHLTRKWYKILNFAYLFRSLTVCMNFKLFSLGKHQLLNRNPRNWCFVSKSRDTMLEHLEAIE